MTEAAARAHDVESAHHRGRTPAQIEADIDQARARLAGTLDQIVDHAHPRHVAQRGAQRAKERLSSFTGAFRTPEGRPRVDRVGPAAVGAALLVSLLVWRRKRR